MRACNTGDRGSGRRATWKGGAPSRRVSRSRAMPTGGRRSKPAASSGGGAFPCRLAMNPVAGFADEADAVELLGGRSVVTVRLWAWPFTAGRGDLAVPGRSQEGILRSLGVEPLPQLRPGHVLDLLADPVAGLPHETDRIEPLGGGLSRHLRRIPSSSVEHARILHAAARCPRGVPCASGRRCAPFKIASQSGLGAEPIAPRDQPTGARPDPNTAAT